MATSAQMARGLAWFGIALGAAELLAPKRVAGWAGLNGHSRLVRLFGAREIVSGVAMLASETPEKRLWMRVAGDALDTSLLASRMRTTNPHRGRTLLATLLVAPVVLLDCLHARSTAAGAGPGARKRRAMKRATEREHVPGPDTYSAESASVASASPLHWH